MVERTSLKTMTDMLSPERILEIAGGYRASASLLAALELGLFTELAKGPRTQEQLVRAFRLNAVPATEFLDGLVALDLLRREGAGGDAIYLNTRESAHFLDSKSSAYIGTQLKYDHVRLAPLWQVLTTGIRSDEAAGP